jgi:hypothetical protein
VETLVAERHHRVGDEKLGCVAGIEQFSMSSLGVFDQAEFMDDRLRSELAVHRISPGRSVRTKASSLFPNPERTAPQKRAGRRRPVVRKIRIANAKLHSRTSPIERGARIQAEATARDHPM